MARKPSTKSLVPDLPEPLDPAEMFALEHTEFEDVPDTVQSVFNDATASVLTVTGIEAETHFSTNTKGQPRVGMRLGTYRRITDFLMHLDVSNVALRSAVGDLSDSLEGSERQRAELKEGVGRASLRIAELEHALADEHAKAAALAEIVREAPAAEHPAPVAQPDAADSAAVADLLAKVSAYRTGLASQRGGAESLLAFDEVFLAANKI